MMNPPSRSTVPRLFPVLAFLILALHASAGERNLVNADVLGPLPQPGLYPKLVDPSEFPDYERRGFRMPTWKTLDNRPQMVANRYGNVTEVTSAQATNILADDARMPGAAAWLTGRVYQPNLSLMKLPVDGLTSVLRHMDSNGIYLFDIAGYGPGTPLNGGSYGQLHLSADQKKSLEETLGDRWMGFDLGEQDGRYQNGFIGRQLPAPRDRVTSHRLFRDWIDRVIDDQGGRISMLTVQWGWHYPVQDGAMAMIGAESESKCGITSPQVQYAFLRGAGKQYGVLWFGNVATFGNSGAKGWLLHPDGSISTNLRGSSLNLMRRLFLSEWLWNSGILSFEGSTFARTEDRRESKVSPLGAVQLATERLIRGGFSPGVLQTPVAVLQDYFSGWMPARTITTSLHAMNSFSYRPGDHLTDAILSMIYPGYEDSGWYYDERGAISPTPYGEIADCLLGDVRSEILSRYSLVLVSGIEHDTAGLRDRLDAFCSGGGIVMATGDDAARIWPEFVGKDSVAMPAGTEVRWASGKAVDREEHGFALRTAVVPQGAEVLATCNGKPAVLRISHKGGTLILSMASTGLNADPLPAAPMRNPFSGHGENTPFERPYRLLSHVRRAYDDALRSQRLFTAGEGLTISTGRRQDGTFVVGVSNPGLESRPFRIESHIGPVASLKEVPIGDHPDTAPGYWPADYGPYNPRATKEKPGREVTGELKGKSLLSDQGNILGGDMRLFEVTLKECTAPLKPELGLPGAPHDRLLLAPDLVTMRERLLSWPRFSHYFDGVALPSAALIDTDPQWLGDHAEWFRRHGIRILVDAGEVQPEALTPVIERLSSFGKGSELVAGKLPDALAAKAATAGIVLRSPENIHRLSAGTVPVHYGRGIEVLEGNWGSWDGLYRDVRAAWGDPAAGTAISGPGVVPSLPAGKAKEGIKRLVSMRGIADPARAVAERPGLLEHFDGLILDARWLEGRSREALAKDREWLRSRGLSVVIDFTRMINRFPDLTFDNGVPHMYEESLRRFDASLDKMAILGSRDALICSHEFDPAEHRNVVSGAKDMGNQGVGIERFLDKAAALGVTAHWLPSSVRPPSKLPAHAAQVAEFQKRHPNLRIIASTVDEPDPVKLTQGMAPAGDPVFWLLAAPETSGERSGQRYLPLATLSKEQLDAILKSAQGHALLFDADYLSWDEVLKDASLTGTP